MLSYNATSLGDTIFIGYRNMNRFIIVQMSCFYIVILFDCPNPLS